MKTEQSTTYERPTLVELGTVQEMTLQNYPAAGQDKFAFLHDGFGS